MLRQTGGTGSLTAGSEVTFQYQLEHELYHCRKRSPLLGLAVMEVHKQLGVGRHENTIYNCQGRRMPVVISSEHFEI